MTQIVLYDVIMKLVILLCILPLTLGDIHVTCIYSEDCLLPCTSTNLDIIHWYVDKTPVHSFYHNTDQLKFQSEDYKGRTSLLPESEIKKGNISLLLKNIRVLDEGKYKCYSADDKTSDEKFVSVSVEAPVKSVDITLKDDTVTCTTSGVYPKPHVSWSSHPQAKEPVNDFHQTDEKLFMVTSELKMDTISSTYKYTCSMNNTDRTKTATLEEQDVTELPENDEIIFKCLIPKDVNYTLMLNLTTTVLTYDSRTSTKHVSEQWKDKVTFYPENGTVKLSHLNKEQMGTYICEGISTDKDRYITQARVSSSGLELGHIGIIVGIIVVIGIGIAIFVVMKKKSPKKHASDGNTQQTSKDETETKTKMLNGSEDKSPPEMDQQTLT